MLGQDYYCVYVFKRFNRNRENKYWEKERDRKRGSVGIFKIIYKIDLLIYIYIYIYIYDLVYLEEDDDDSLRICNMNKFISCGNIFIETHKNKRKRKKKEKKKEKIIRIKV